MNKLFSVLLLFAFSFYYSQDWKFLFQNNNEYFYYKTNTKNTAWIKVISDKTEYYPRNSSDINVIEGYTLTLWKFDCENKSITPLQINVYSKKGDLLQNVQKENYLIEMKYVAPDSVGEGFLNVFCNKED